MARRTLFGWLAILALLSLFTGGKWALAPVAWVAPVVGLYIAHRTSPGRGFLLLTAALYLPLCIAWYGAAPFPMPIYPLFMLWNTIVGVLPYLLDRLLLPRLGQGFATTLIFPAAVTAVEYLFTGDGPLGSFGAQAYTQVAFAPLAQFASVAGLWGITFMVAWFASVAHRAVSRHAQGAPYRREVALYAVILLLVLAYGTFRLLGAPVATEQVRIASVTTERVQMGEMMELYRQDESTFRARTMARDTTYLDAIRRAAQSGAQVVMLPELAGLGMADDVSRFVESAAALADESNIYLALPLFELDPAGGAAPINRVVLADPQGNIVLNHVKYGGNLLEGTQPGERAIQSVETPFGTLAVIICWDTDYPSVVRQAGQQGVDILLSPAYVWSEVAEIHADMATFRAIENGLTLVRHSDNGYSLVSDAFGRVTAQENYIGQDNVLFRADAPLLRTATLYPTLGDVVGQASLAALLVVIALLLVRRARRVLTQRAAPAPEGV